MIRGNDSPGRYWMEGAGRDPGQRGREQMGPGQQTDAGQYGGGVRRPPDETEHGMSDNQDGMAEQVRQRERREAEAEQEGKEGEA
jgi:hypothetical protein